MVKGWVIFSPSQLEVSALRTTSIQWYLILMFSLPRTPLVFTRIYLKGLKGRPHLHTPTECHQRFVLYLETKDLSTGAVSPLSIQNTFLYILKQRNESVDCGVLTIQSKPKIKRTKTFQINISSEGRIFLRKMLLSFSAQ